MSPDLGDIVEIEHRNVRSVNLEFELEESSPLVGFILSEKVLDGCRRCLGAGQEGPSSRAWSVIGPYGAGKSSFAQFLMSLLGNEASQQFSHALSLLASSDREVAKMVSQIRATGPGKRGLIRAVATARDEAIGRTVLRALSRGAHRYWEESPGRNPAIVERLAARVEDHESQVSSQEIIELIDQLTNYAPVVIVIDELGKALEYAARSGSDGDLYLLQQLAERFSSAEKFEGAIMVLQHLSFEDYAGGVSSLKRREWRKVQGRYEEIQFLGTENHAARLLGEAIAVKGLPSGPKKTYTGERAALLEAAPNLHTIMKAVGRSPAGYPLHPTVIPALVTLSGRYGQHDRSLFAFLTSDEEHSLRNWIDSGPGEADLYRLANLYDYFVEGTAALVIAGDDAVRLREIRNRLSEAVGLSDLETLALKTVGVLNLVVQGGFRASPELVQQALAGANPEVTDRKARRAIDTLAERGLVIYREFANEYRVWQGSDFDIEGALDRYRSMSEQALALNGIPTDELSRVAKPRHLVASRHSQETGTLRFFEARYVSSITEQDVDAESTAADGVLLLHIGPLPSDVEVPSRTSDGLPVIVVASGQIDDLADAVLDALSTTAVLESEAQLEHDIIARAEVRQRAALSQEILRERLREAFQLGTQGVVCFARGAEVKVTHHGALSTVASSLCDEAYSGTVHLQNEMLNRRELTSQGAKARRELIEAMCTKGGKAGLELEGNGPEVSMFKSVLEATRLYSMEEGSWRFVSPAKGSQFRGPWERIEETLEGVSGEGTVSFDQVFARLSEPPIGMREGLIPVVVAWFLLARADDVYVFEEGSFLPFVGPEHFERMMKAPSRFSAKVAKLGNSQLDLFRGLHQVAEEAGGPGETAERNSGALSVIRPLIRHVRGLSDFALKTKTVSITAQEVRHAIMTATEPEGLLEQALPKACGLSDLGGNAGSREESQEFLATLTSALAELDVAYPSLQERCLDSLAEAFRIRGSKSNIREDLRSRSRLVVEHVIDRRLRSFLLMAANDEMDDAEWIEAIGTVLAQKPPASWDDSDVAVFESALIELAAPFKRLELLHLQMEVTDQAGFSASRVTLTQPDGREYGEVLMVEDRKEAEIRKVAQEALERARLMTGHDADAALLAVLASEVLTESEATITDERTNLPQGSDSQESA